MATSVKDLPKGEQPLATRLLLSCGAIDSLLFIVVFLLEGATRADWISLLAFQLMSKKSPIAR